MEMKMANVDLTSKIEEIEDLFKVTSNIFLKKCLEKYKTIDELKNCIDFPGDLESDIYKFLSMYKNWDKDDYEILENITTQDGIDTKTDDKYNLLRKAFSKWITHEKTYRKDCEEMNYYIEKFINKDTDISTNTIQIMEDFYNHTKDEDCSIGYDPYDYDYDDDDNYIGPECQDCECDTPSLCSDCKVYKKPLKNKYYDNTNGRIYPIVVDRASLKISVMQSDKIDKLVAIVKDKKELDKYINIYKHAYVDFYYASWPEYYRISEKDEHIKGVGKNNKYDSTIYSIVIDRTCDTWFPSGDRAVYSLAHGITTHICLQIIDMIVDDIQIKL